MRRGVENILLAPPAEAVLYARSQLRGERLAAYDAIAAGLAAGQPRVRVDVDVDGRDLLDVALLVPADHPELYWAGRSVSVESAGRRRWVVWRDARLPARDESEKIERAVQTILRHVTCLPGEYERVRAVYQAISSHVSYDHEAVRTGDAPGPRPEAYTLVGALLKQRAVCQGSASAVQYLLQRCGIMAYRLGGVAKAASGTGNHAWVLVRVGGSFYHMDPTWGAVAARPGKRVRLVDADYDYFLLNDAEVAPTHRAVSRVPLPACTDTRDNWYRREGYVLERWDEATLRTMLARQLAAARRSPAVRAADEQTFRELRAWVADPARVGSVLAAAAVEVGVRVPRGSYSFYTNEHLRTVHLVLEPEVCGA
jgi:hypothetical protein